jgi:hypothetical protein
VNAHLLQGCIVGCGCRRRSGAQAGLAKNLDTARSATERRGKKERRKTAKEVEAKKTGGAVGAGQLPPGYVFENGELKYIGS